LKSKCGVETGAKERGGRAFHDAERAVSGCWYAVRKVGAGGEEVTEARATAGGAGVGRGDEAHSVGRVIAGGMSAEEGEDPQE